MVHLQPSILMRSGGRNMEESRTAPYRVLSTVTPRPSSLYRLLCGDKAALVSARGPREGALLPPGPESSGGPLSGSGLFPRWGERGESGWVRSKASQTLPQTPGGGAILRGEERPVGQGLLCHLLHRQDEAAGRSVCPGPAGQDGAAGGSQQAPPGLTLHPTAHCCLFVPFSLESLAAYVR